MPTLAYFFYELPHNTGLDSPDTLILSGYRIKGTPRDIYPFGFANTYRLDDRSQALIGQETVTVPDTDLVEDAPAGNPDPVPVADDSQLCFDFNALTARKAKPKPEPRFMPHGMNTVDSN